MPEIRGTIDIARPVEDVFAYLKEPKKNVEWESAVVESEMTSEGPIGVGSKGRRVEKTMGTDEGVWEITQFEENKLIEMGFESDKFVGKGAWELQSANGATRLAYRFQGETKSFLFKLLMPLMMPMMKRMIRKDYGRLKEILESQS
jgi:uncharacterized protein YndB with AHSA1/START domain